MRSDKFDKKIIEAADNHHPAYDGNGWKHMEQLLDKHLPKKEEKKRRFIFFLLLFVLLGGAGVWYFSENDMKVTNDLSGSAITPLAETQTKESPVTIKEKTKDRERSEIQLSESVLSPSAKSLLNTEKNKKTGFKTLSFINQVESSNESGEIQLKMKERKNNNNVSYENNSNPVVAELVDQSEIKETVQNFETSAIDENNKEISRNIESPDTSLKNSVEDEKETEFIIKEKEKKKKSGFLFLSVSAGPDLSFVSGNRSGTVKLSGGVGIGYTLKNGLSFKTGFYSGRKVYSTSPDSYNPPPGFTQYYPILENVDADCKIYEIPVTIHYNFVKSEKQNWFAGAGLSTLLMKKEKYTYTYKYNPSGPSYYKDWVINNENEHYFSTLTLSGGFQRQLSKTVSVSAEPYIKIPLQGIGYGKVKLNSTGIMFNLLVKPFQSKAKK